MIYIDLDYTMIDSAVRLKLEMAAAQKYGIDETGYWRAVDIAFAKYGISRFNYDTLYEACCEVKPDFSPEARNDWQKILELQHFFPDTLFFLKSFKKEKLTLLTTGSREFQRAKIETHGLKQYFSEIKIVDSPKCQHITPSNDLNFFLDDSPREIDAMKNLYPFIECIQMRQPASWEKQKVSERADVHCATLWDAFDYIAGLLQALQASQKYINISR